MFILSLALAILLLCHLCKVVSTLSGDSWHLRPYFILKIIKLKRRQTEEYASTEYVQCGSSIQKRLFPISVPMYEAWHRKWTSVFPVACTRIANSLDRCGRSHLKHRFVLSICEQCRPGLLWFLHYIYDKCFTFDLYVKLNNCQLSNQKQQRGDRRINSIKL